MSDNDPIVGHKTHYTKERGFWHTPLHKSEADELLRRVEEREERYRKLMPDEDAAIQMLSDAVHRLKELGWRDAIYCHKDGREFLALEAGSTGKHICTYQGKWPDGHWWLHDKDGDVYPSHPVLFKDKP